jgi:hypothetical protein
MHVLFVLCAAGGMEGAAEVVFYFSLLNACHLEACHFHESDHIIQWW